jgi:hypothetical protein
MQPYESKHTWDFLEMKMPSRLLHSQAFSTTCSQLPHNDNGQVEHDIKTSCGKVEAPALTLSMSFWPTAEMTRSYNATGKGANCQEKGKRSRTPQQAQK